MAISLAEIQEKITLSEAPAAQLLVLIRARQQDIFCQLFETVQTAFVNHMSLDQLHQFARRLAPNVLGFMIFRRLESSHSVCRSEPTADFAEEKEVQKRCF